LGRKWGSRSLLGQAFQQTFYILTSLHIPVTL
jgi:hypothetical protein